MPATDGALSAGGLGRIGVTGGQQYTEGHKGHTAVAEQRPDRRHVTPDEWRSYQTHGYLVCKGLVQQEDVEELREHMAALRSGAAALPPLPPGEREKIFKLSSTPSELSKRPPSMIGPDGKIAAVLPNAAPVEEEAGPGELLRMHMLHRVDETVERFILHPRVLDVLELLVGPDVSCLQSMLFFNPPGHGGQGWHQVRVAAHHLFCSPPLLPFSSAL